MEGESKGCEQLNESAMSVLKTHTVVQVGNGAGAHILDKVYSCI